MPLGFNFLLNISMFFYLNLISDEFFEMVENSLFDKFPAFLAFFLFFCQKILQKYYNFVTKMLQNSHIEICRKGHKNVIKNRF